MPPDAFLIGSKYANIAFAARAPPGTPLGKLTGYSAPPDLLAGKGEWGPGMAPTRKGGAPGRRGGGREGEGRGKGGKLLPPGVRFYG